MYKQTFNLLSRLLALLFFILSTVVASNPFVMLINIIILLGLSYLYNQKTVISFLILLLGIYNVINPIYFVPLKILVVLYYFTLFIKIMLNDDYIYIYEKLFYTLKSKKLTNKLLKKLYYPTLFKNNMHKYFNINKLSKNKNKYLKKLVMTKTKKDLEDIKLTYYMRFYNREKKRTNIIRNVWEPKDNSFILVHIAILIISIIYRG
jgi:hypothetical protein